MQESVLSVIANIILLNIIVTWQIVKTVPITAVILTVLSFAILRNFVGYMAGGLAS
jgi:hypothetical protein